MSHIHAVIRRLDTAVDLYTKLEERNDPKWASLLEIVAVYINKQVADAELLLGIEYK